MEQLMEPQAETLSGGPRHAKPVTLVGRLKFALSRGPAKWSWKTNTIVVLLFIGIVVGLSIGASIIAVTSLVDIKDL